MNRVWYAVWFLFGVVVAQVIQQPNARLPDSVNRLPQSLIDQLPVDSKEQVQGHKIGRFLVLTPKDSRQGGAVVLPERAPYYPQVVLVDERGDGRVNGVSVMDAKDHGVVIDDEDTDTYFDKYSFWRGASIEATSFHDTDMDGEYNLRFSPGRKLAIKIDGEWRDVIQRDDRRFVNIEGQLVKLKYIDGSWQIEAQDGKEQGERNKEKGARSK